MSNLYTKFSLLVLIFFLSICLYYNLLNSHLSIGNDTSVAISLLYDFYIDLKKDLFEVSLIDQTRYLGYNRINDYILFFNPVYLFSIFITFLLFDLSLIEFYKSYVYLIIFVKIITTILLYHFLQNSNIFSNISNKIKFYCSIIFFLFISFDQYLGAAQNLIMCQPFIILILIRIDKYLKKRTLKDILILALLSYLLFLNTDPETYTYILLNIFLYLVFFYFNKFKEITFYKDVMMYFFLKIIFLSYIILPLIVGLDESYRSQINSTSQEFKILLKFIFRGDYSSNIYWIGMGVLFFFLSPAVFFYEKNVKLIKISFLILINYLLILGNNFFLYDLIYAIVPFTDSFRHSWKHLIPLNIWQLFFILLVVKSFADNFNDKKFREYLINTSKILILFFLLSLFIINKKFLFDYIIYISFLSIILFLNKRNILNKKKFFLIILFISFITKIFFLVDKNRNNHLYENRNFENLSIYLTTYSKNINNLKIDLNNNLFLILPINGSMPITYFNYLINMKQFSGYDSNPSMFYQISNDILNKSNIGIEGYKNLGVDYVISNGLVENDNLKYISEFKTDIFLNDLYKKNGEINYIYKIINNKIYTNDNSKTSSENDRYKCHELLILENKNCTNMSKKIERKIIYNFVNLNTLEVENNSNEKFQLITDLIYDSSWRCKSLNSDKCVLKKTNINLLKLELNEGNKMIIYYKNLLFNYLFIFSYLSILIAISFSIIWQKFLQKN